MKFIADIHIHSHYSLATSKQLVPEHLDYWAQIKGIDVIGTGDCTHPDWIAELTEKLTSCGNGLYQLKKEHKLKEPFVHLPKNCQRKVSFILTGEVSSIYKKHGQLRKIHSLCVFPDFKSTKRFQEQLAKRGNIQSDGRPILGMDAKHILELVLECSNGKGFVVPAHIWTPWFSLFGSMSGFDCIEDCYEELTPHIFALETGLSSDPAMNSLCSSLDKFTLISNSDAHSPEKLGREANCFNTEASYSGIYNALKTGKGFEKTIEFFPQEGKYHYDGHRACGVCWEPNETISNNGICAVCKKPVTKGVSYRVSELSDRKKPGCNRNFSSIIPMIEIVSEVVQKGPASQTAKKRYFELIESLGPEFHILLTAPIDTIKQHAGQHFSEAIKRLRKGDVHMQEGFDGQFGKITAFEKGELETLNEQPLVAVEKTPSNPKSKYKKKAQMKTQQKSHIK